MDVHLEGVGGDFASSADVLRQKPTAELELQYQLITISTLFGIGISLLVEAFLLFLISLVARRHDEDAP